MTDPLKPSSTLLCKLGSMVVHCQEGLSSKGHELDLIALKQLLHDEEVVLWLRAMDELALIPVKR